MATNPLKSIADVRKVASSIADTFGITKNAAAKIVRAYGPEAENYMNAAKQGLTSQAYDLARGMGAFGTEIRDPDTARRAIESIAQDPAYIRGVTDADLRGMPEFKTYFDTFRNAVVDPKTGGLRKAVGVRGVGGKISPALEGSPRANPVTGSILGTRPTQGDLTGSLVKAALDNDEATFASTMATRVSNQMSLLRRLDLEAAAAMQQAGLPSSRFYSTTNDLQEVIAQVTGLPRHMVSTAMAVASAGSSPYDELIKISNVAPYLREQGGKVIFDKAAAVKDGLLVSAVPEQDVLYRVGKAMQDAINGVDPITSDFGGLALKTYQYRNIGFDPNIQSISVSDRIAQRLAAGAGEGVDSTQGLIYAAAPDWAGSQAIGKAEGVSAATPQELGWFAQRVSEIATPFNPRRITSQSFPMSPDDVRDVMTGVQRPDIAEWSLEGKRIGKGLKQLRPGGISPEVADYAQQYANLGQVSAGMSDDLTMLPPFLRESGINRDIVGATQALSGPLSQVISGLKTPSRRAYGMALPPAMIALMEAARNRNQTQEPDQVASSALDRMASA
jgi:hypothetical protein